MLDDRDSSVAAWLTDPDVQREIEIATEAFKRPGVTQFQATLLVLGLQILDAITAIAVGDDGPGGPGEDIFPLPLHDDDDEEPWKKRAA